MGKIELHDADSERQLHRRWPVSLLILACITVSSLLAPKISTVMHSHARRRSDTRSKQTLNTHNARMVARGSGSVSVLSNHSHEETSNLLLNYLLSHQNTREKHPGLFQSQSSTLAIVVLKRIHKISRDLRDFIVHTSIRMPELKHAKDKASIKFAR